MVLDPEGVNVTVGEKENWSGPTTVGCRPGLHSLKAPGDINSFKS